MEIKGRNWRETLDEIWQEYRDKNWYNDYYNLESQVQNDFTVNRTIKSGFYNSFSTSLYSYQAIGTSKDYFKVLNDYLPDYYKLSKDIEKIRYMAQTSLVGLDVKISEIENKIIPNLVTAETLHFFETKYGIENINKTNGFSFRKNIILAYYFKLHNDATHDNIVKILEILGGKDVYVTFTKGKNVGMSLNINTDYNHDILELLRAFLPAYLGITITNSKSWGYVYDTGNKNWQNTLDEGNWGSFLV